MITNINLDSIKNNNAISNSAVHNFIKADGSINNIEYEFSKLPGGSNNSKVILYTDGEGGNFRLISSNGNHVEMDMFNNEDIRIYAGTPTNEVDGQVIWNKNHTIDLSSMKNKLDGMLNIKCIEVTVTVNSAINKGAFTYQGTSPEIPGEIIGVTPIAWDGNWIVSAAISNGNRHYFYAYASGSGTINCKVLYV